MLSGDALRTEHRIWTMTFTVDMKNALNIVSRQAVRDECATFFPERYHGCHGVMGPILCCDTHLAISAQSLECMQ